MTSNRPFPRVVLLCHEHDPIDAEGLAGWLASSFDLAGIVLIRDPPGRRLRAARFEWRRSGVVGLADVLACRAYCALVHRSRDRVWVGGEVRRLRRKYPAPLQDVSRLIIGNPNAPEVRTFLTRLQPDLLIARCKVILRPEIFTVPKAGTFVLHPGICPEYRNAHGCFWALARRDLDRVGMTLLRVDPGIDTGPVYFQAGYRFDERHESPTIIQYRVVTENLDAIADVLSGVCSGTAIPVSTKGRMSRVWGQPRLTAYLRWRRAARQRVVCHSNPEVAP